MLLLRSIYLFFEEGMRFFFFFFVYTFTGCTSQQGWMLWQAGLLYILQLLPVVSSACPNLHLACHLSQFVASVASVFSFVAVKSNGLEHGNEKEVEKAAVYCLSHVDFCRLDSEVDEKCALECYRNVSSHLLNCQQGVLFQNLYAFRGWTLWSALWISMLFQEHVCIFVKCFVGHVVCREQCSLEKLISVLYLANAGILCTLP